MGAQRPDLLVENIIDMFGKMMTEIKKVYLAANLDYTMTLQFIDILEKNGKIRGDERIRLKDEIETKEGKPKVTYSAERVQRS